MNAGGVPNTCKSNAETAMTLSGERVSNALVTCPIVWDNRSKGLLIPDEYLGVRDPGRKDGENHSLREGPASHQLVGRVMAYQGDDG
jgi:hypothetical protein